MDKLPTTFKNRIYLYDLPLSNVTAVGVAQLVKQATGYDLKSMPQLMRDPSKPFVTALIKIEDDE